MVVDNTTSPFRAYAHFSELRLLASLPPTVKNVVYGKFFDIPLDNQCVHLMICFECPIASVNCCEFD